VPGVGDKITAMRDFFYSTEDGILFQVLGYAASDSGASVVEKIQNIQREMDDFVKIAKCQPEQVKTAEILQSCRYKNMRVYWCDIAQAPQLADCFVTSWKMWDWLAY